MTQISLGLQLVKLHEAMMARRIRWINGFPPRVITSPKHALKGFEKAISLGPVGWPGNIAR